MKRGDWWLLCGSAVALASAACSLDFDKYEPAESTDASAAMDAIGDGGPPGSDGSGPVDSGAAGACGQTCLSQASQCGSGCESTLATCLTNCQGGFCTRMCQTTEQGCVQRCTRTCDTCMGSAGCSGTNDCAVAAITD